MKFSPTKPNGCRKQPTITAASGILKASNRLLLFSFITIIFFTNIQAHAQTGTSSWVGFGSNGKLQYTPDAKGNRIPDFSMVGYRFGNEAIPTIPVVKTLNAVSGDNLTQIQAAVDEVAALPLGSNGFRGAILLKKGEYNISNTISINAGGIVIRGEGSGAADTRLIATKTAQHTLFDIKGTGGPVEVSGSRTKVTTAYVATGVQTFAVQSASSFAVGDEIIFRVEPKAAWITLLDMAQYGWTPAAYNMNYIRKITAISGNNITIDAPVVDPVDAALKDAYIYKYTWNHIENIGVENIRFSSTYASATDENHGWTAISFNNARHGWVRDCEFYSFGYSAVHVLDWGVNISVLNCKNIDPVSQLTGGRRYSFNCNGQLALFKDCYTRNGRHDFVTGSTTAGPNAFVNCKADDMHADIGPHHRWATGLLLDNVIGNLDINVQNRRASGTGHGWAGAQCVFWNVTGGRKIIVQMPPQHFNWAIGCKGDVTADGNYQNGDPGIWESIGNFVPPQSLYVQQLQDRLNITTPTCVPATASGDDGNVAANVLDNNLNTRWSHNGDGQWIQLCLSDTLTFSSVQIAFYSGNTRTSTFDILVGNDGTNFTTVAAGRVSSGTSLNLETFSFPAVSAKYVRIVGHGNSVNLWNSYTEVKVPTGAQQYTYLPLHDAYVRDGSNAAITHGTTDSTLLITKVSPAGQLNNAREAYLRFNATGTSGLVTSATLRVYGKVDLTTVPTVPVAAYAVSNTSWTENALTWNNKPATGAALDTVTVNNTAYAYYSFDVTNYVNAELTAGRTNIAFAMKSLVAHDPRIFWNSSEAGSNPPQLLISTGQQQQITSLPAVVTEKTTPVMAVSPNPFRGTSSVNITMKKAGMAQVVVYDMSGRRVATLHQGVLAAGNHRFRFTPSGKGTQLYIISFKADGKTELLRILHE
ncbi:DNRLRE domain-containing protein [Pseudoflavitalea sp. G-6-1-2]|uniref:CBM96 family carbohydrate-binding protein n=1 Tax=Pseudoflavitalea sp. G-6-1-2 TaxID=2728841 RepID=UPI00146A0856|nr:DNRLRE domain-containing protein [Pseudoflavitalea sp. G-6-1-2]NML21761.1 DNRLRE domain-containing protein [Pseudoflavitalea sp. G-6-1-2]